MSPSCVRWFPSILCSGFLITQPSHISNLSIADSGKNKVCSAGDVSVLGEMRNSSSQVLWSWLPVSLGRLRWVWDSRAGLSVPYHLMSQASCTLHPSLSLRYRHGEQRWLKVTDKGSMFWGHRDMPFFTFPWITAHCIAVRLWKLFANFKLFTKFSLDYLRFTIFFFTIF